jgi:hypothetical protein
VLGQSALVVNYPVASHATKRSEQRLDRIVHAVELLVRNGVKVNVLEGLEGVPFP